MQWGRLKPEYITEYITEYTQLSDGCSIWVTKYVWLQPFVS